MHQAGASLPFEDALRLSVRKALGPYRSVDAILAEATLIFIRRLLLEAGLRRRGACVDLRVDEPAELERLVRARCGCG